MTILFVVCCLFFAWGIFSILLELIDLFFPLPILQRVFEPFVKRYLLPSDDFLIRMARKRSSRR